jgi:hypothetical protein
VPVCFNGEHQKKSEVDVTGNAIESEHTIHFCRFDRERDTSIVSLPRDKNSLINKGGSFGREVTIYHLQI